MQNRLSVRKAPPAMIGRWIDAMPQLLANLETYPAGSEQVEETLYYLFPKHQSPVYDREHLFAHARTYKLYLEQFPRPISEWIICYCPSGTDEAYIALDKLRFLAEYARHHPDDYEDANLFMLDPDKGYSKFQREAPAAVCELPAEDKPAMPNTIEGIAAVLIQTLQDAGFTVGPDPYNPNRYVVTDHKTYRHTGANLTATIGRAVKQLAILGRI